MKLPGATYGTPVQSLGRLTGPTDSGATAALRAGAARAAVGEALSKVAGVAQAWAEAEEEVKAMRAVNEYRDEMTKFYTDLKNSPSIPTNAIPDGVTFERERVGDDGTKVVRETVPSWEVAPAMIDNQHRVASQKAMSQVTSTKARAAVENSISDAYRQISTSTATFHFTEKKNSLTAEVNRAIQKSVENGDERGALSALATGVRTGLFSALEAQKEEVKIRNDAATRRTGMALVALEHSTEPFEVVQERRRALQTQVLTAPGALTAAQQVNFSNAVGDQMARAESAKEKAITKARDDVSDKMFNDVREQWTVGGRLPSNAQISAMKNQMKPEDYRAMLTFIDEKRKGAGGIKTDQQVARGIQLEISKLYEATDVPVDQRARSIDDAINKAHATGRLEWKDAEALRVDVRQNTERAIGPQNPAVKAAHEKLNGLIKPYTSGLVATGSKDDYYHLVVTDAETDLRRAMATNPRLDPNAWVDENGPKYKARVMNRGIKEMRKLGVDGHIIYDPVTRQIDTAKTTANLDKAYKAGAFPAAVFSKATNAANGIVKSTVEDKQSPTDEPKTGW